MGTDLPFGHGTCQVGEHRTLGGFCPALYGEKVILGGSIQDSRYIERGRS